MKTIKDLDKYLVEECEYRPQRVANMSAYDKVDAWLKWEGIIGYTDEILRIIGIAYNKSLPIE